MRRTLISLPHRDYFEDFNYSPGQIKSQPRL